MKKNQLNHRKCLSLTFLFLLLLSVMGAQAQEKVTGTVKDVKGIPLPGVSILEKGKKNGSRTDEKGNFSIQLTAPNAVLVFSYLGYKTIETSAVTTGGMGIVLQDDIAGLDEVVVIGYGTQRKGDVTSAVVSVKAADFLGGNVQDASDLIRSKVAGLNITKGSGDPNASSRILLRGISTLEGSTSPLILVDGVVGDMATVAPESIESVDVLKDASAAAIYGTRGANGVILITTKKGSRGEQSQVTYHSYASVSNYYKLPEFMSAQDVREGLTSFTDQGTETDWIKEVTRTGITQNHSLNLSGGMKNTTYSANVTYRDENGVINGTNANTLKSTFDINHYMLNDIVKLNFNVIVGEKKNNATVASDLGVVNVYRQALIRNPTAPVYNTDGSYYEDYNVFQYYNPVAMVNEFNGERKERWSRLTGNLTIEPVKGWKTNIMLSRNTETGLYGYYATKKYFSSTINGYNGSAYRSDADSRSDNMELTSSYNKTIGKHSFTALAGYSYLYNVFESGSMFNFNFPTDVYSYHNINQGVALKDGRASIGSSKSDDKLIGFFGRLSYNYDNRFNLLASFRREGSTKFGDNNKWGSFPAVSAGWTLSNEAFMKDLTWLSSLKLRAGYGVTGVIPGSSYLSLTKYNYGTNYFVDGKWVSGLGPTEYNPNPDLHWEKSKELNIGVDFSLFKERLSGSVDVYNKKTSDMLWDYNVPLPPNLSTLTKANVGKMQNKGIEVMLAGVPVRGEAFEWRSNLTFSHNKNKLVSLSNDLYQTVNFLNTGYAGDPISVPTHRLEVGQSFGNYWGLKSVGLSENGLWMIENPQTGEAEEFQTSMLTDNYRQYLGNGLPKVFLGWGNTFKYKRFDLNVQMSAQLGFEILNEQRMFYENNSIAYNRLASAKDLVYGVSTLSTAQSQTFVSYYLEKGDFLKMDNVALGYTFDLSKSKAVKNLRLYVTGENLFCITKYSGLDPELTNTDLQGAGNDPRDKYPTIRSFTFGINVLF
ncbi:SusC/RagA family TonB-linked outer membrane protein [Pedobacter sp. AW31-3R]|uniref:SusC/RagA family TonB-linked outer membrane protein n=1 Tax=Pedobacter sp. AW31-3R TaxID=3445781 RepID=UPI003FA0BDCA